MDKLTSLLEGTRNVIRYIKDVRGLPGEEALMESLSDAYVEYVAQNHADRKRHIIESFAQTNLSLFSLESLEASYRALTMDRERYSGPTIIDLDDPLCPLCKMGVFVDGQCSYCNADK